MLEESRVLPGAEPFYFEGNSVGILVSHGFTGTTQSMRPLCEAYAKAGYTVCGPRLKGHGTHYMEMESTTRQDWKSSIEKGYKWLKERCDHIFVTGLSMGGTLTLYCAEIHPDLKGIIPINATIDASSMKDAIHGPRFIDGIGSDIKNPNVSELAYEKTPTKSIQELILLASEVEAKLDQITCPILLFVSQEDHVVEPINSQNIYERVSSSNKEMITLKESYHVATLDNDQQLIIDKTLAFINKIMG